MTQRSRDSAGASGTVLVVDHDHTLRLLARRLLETEGYRVLDAGDAASAEQLVTLYVGPIHVLVIDVDMSTRGLSDHLQSLHPELAVLFASGRPQRELVGRGRLAARAPFVRKPFEKSRLAAKIRDVLARPG